MPYENEIPEYALQPAKAPKVTPAEAVYTSRKVTSPQQEQTVIYQFEEDILVPDTKPDMREILLMDATCDIMPTEKKVSPKTDDLMNVTGTICIQTLYASESEEREPVSITSKVPYKYQWSLNPADQMEGVFCCSVKNLESMIINERKFRVKITLEFTARLFCQREFKFFDSLKGESLETKKTQISLTCLELVRKDAVSIDETFSCKDPSVKPEYILKQDFTVTENYRQVTSEKVVINGFLFVSLLYSASGAAEEDGATLCHHNQRIEFTQFVPIEKEKRGKNWSAVKTGFSGKDLSVSIEQEEEGEIKFRVKGEIQTRVELYESRQQDVIVDAYHREKNFQCSFTKEKIFSLSDGAMAETSIREIINLPEGVKASEAVYCAAKITQCQCGCEKGRIVVTGKISCRSLWKDPEGNYHQAGMNPDFRGIVDMDQALPGKKALCTPVIKSAWVTLINEKQLEMNCVIALCVELYDDGEIILLEQPVFAEQPKEKEYPMVIVTIKKGETLWDLAKRYATTEANIKAANHLEGEPESGTRLLIIK